VLLEKQDIKHRDSRGCASFVCAKVCAFEEARSETQTLDYGASNLWLKSLCFWGDLERSTENPYKSYIYLKTCACAQNEIYVCLADYIHQRKQLVKDVAFGGFAILDRLLF
jgi:hypothetical protein